MSEKDPQTRDPLTRREYAKYGGTVIGGGLLAGCAGDSDPAASSTETDTPTATDEPTTTEGSSYTVQLAPVGEVTFDETPEEWIAYQYAYGDMGVALGRADGYLGTNKPENYPDFFYDELPGVEFDASTLTNIGSGDKEVFYDLNPDVLFIDPNNAQARFEWSQADIEELTENVAPFFGHFGRRYGYEYQQDYQQRGLYDLFEQVAEVFQEQARYRRIKAIHDDVLVDDVDDELAESALAHLRSEFRAREIDADERERRDREGQRRLLDQLDDDVIREYADTIATTERS